MHPHGDWLQKEGPWFVTNYHTSSRRGHASSRRGHPPSEGDTPPPEGTHPLQKRTRPFRRGHASSRRDTPPPEGARPFLKEHAHPAGSFLRPHPHYRLTHIPTNTLQRAMPSTDNPGGPTITTKSHTPSWAHYKKSYTLLSSFPTTPRSLQKGSTLPYKPHTSSESKNRYYNTQRSRQSLKKKPKWTHWWKKNNLKSILTTYSKLAPQ